MPQCISERCKVGLFVIVRELPKEKTVIVNLLDIGIM